MQVKGKDKKSKLTTKLSNKEEPNDSIQKPGRANQESNQESMKRQLVEYKKDSQSNNNNCNINK